MSIKVSSMVWRARLPSTQKLVAARLADFADDDGCRVFPSNGRVATETGLTDRAVRDTMRALEAAGVLILVALEKPGQRLPREYRFNLAKLVELAAEPQTNTIEGGTTFPPEPRSPRNHVPPTPEPRSPDPSDNHQETTAAATARAPSPVVVVGMEVLRLIGVADDPAWTGNYGRVGQWLADGYDPDLDIYPTIRRKMSGRGPPRTLNFFDGAIADAHAARTKPLPEGTAYVRQTEQRDPVRAGRPASGGRFAEILHRDLAGRA